MTAAVHTCSHLRKSLLGWRQHCNSACFLPAGGDSGSLLPYLPVSSLHPPSMKRLHDGESQIRSDRFNRFLDVIAMLLQGFAHTAGVPFGEAIRKCSLELGIDTQVQRLKLRSAVGRDKEHLPTGIIECLQDFRNAVCLEDI